MAAPDEFSPLSERLKIKGYSHQEVVAAIKGKRIPSALGLPLLRLSTIRGIRYHDGFGNELKGISAEFDRALNARAIMSNRIPEIQTEEQIPYCIWHPEVATEDTYRRLARQYPSMAYQVGRACAVGDYTTLYKEVDVFPDVHIAEEARESGSMEIYEHIMAQPVKFNIMNDYDCTVNPKNLKPAFLNGDTAIYASLDTKQMFTNATVPRIINGVERMGASVSRGFNDTTFNITEDMNIDMQEVGAEYLQAKFADAQLSDLLLELLTSPLPADLPTVDKDLLICMAAYHGDIDRYSRLRRPKMIDGEVNCCVRGIYHNTMFAVWWSKQPLPDEASHHLQRAISARFIMNNVLSEIKKCSDDWEHPYLIWYPSIAQASTYRELAKVAPDMLPQIIRSCIVGDYQELFDELVVNFRPDEAVLKEANASPNHHYKTTLASRVEAIGKAKIETFEEWKLLSHTDLQGSGHAMYESALLTMPVTAFESLYNGLQCLASGVQLMACLPDEWKVPKEEDAYVSALDYVDWPPSETVEDSEGENGLGEDR